MINNAIIIARCSTVKQDTNYQINHLVDKYSEYNIVKIFESYCSGFKNFIDVEKYIDFLDTKNIKIVLVTELNRVSRKERYLKYFIDNCKILDVKIICAFNDKNDSLKKQIEDSALETERIKKRLNAGRELYIKKGGKLGRKRGSKKSDLHFLKENEKVTAFLNMGYSIRKVMSLTNKSSGTVQKVKKLNKKA